MKLKKLFLFDVMPLLYRAHFATLGKQFGTTTGIDTRTTLVFFNYIFQVLTEEKPDAVAAALDSRSKERTEVSSAYKANREKMPAEIADAFPYALRLMEALQIPVLKEDGLEADDIIATLATEGAKMDYEVYIVSPDKDFAQLVSDKVFLFRPAYKGAVMETLNIEGVISKFGVRPDQIADYLALRGDSADNIVGVKGIGDKTAASLLSQFNTVEELISGVDTIKQVKVRESVAEYKNQLLENKQLARLTGNAHVSFEWENLKVSRPDETRLLPLLDELQFVKIKERLARLKFISADKSMAETSLAEVKVIRLTVKEILSGDKLNGLTAVAWLTQQPDFLFVVTDSGKEIYQVFIADNNEWKAIITSLEEMEIITGWLLKPLLKKLTGLGIPLKKTWTDLALAAYLLEPDAKIEWPFIRDKYQLQDYNTPENLNHLPALPEAYEKIMLRIKEMQLTDLLTNIELPLQTALAGMELHGLNLDVPALKEIDLLLSEQMLQLEKRLYELAGSKFNINSPSRTAEILQQMADPAELTKTKTGQISTAENCLTDLAPKYPFVADLLNYRKLNKIITTYVHALPKYVNKDTNRIHPTFQQIVAGTGRLSCTDPNLQNLPVRSEAGREVRKAIIPSGPGFSILSIDYNQVELRLLAALSEDKVMVETFKSGKDIHTTTASRVFNTDEKSVTKDMRGKAKGINFGIAYGITPWGLATRLKITQKEAKQIIDAYFQEFPSVKAYLENSVTESRERGFTQTRYGRIRYIEGINSPNGTTRKVAERIAVNAPIQGLAADIIKEAMVKIDAFLRENNLKTRMILQVHDELVFDAANDELPLLVPEITRLMETGTDFIVPLKVNVTIGKNWLEQTEYLP